MKALDAIDLFAATITSLGGGADIVALRLWINERHPSASFLLPHSVIRVFWSLQERQPALCGIQTAYDSQRQLARVAWSNAHHCILLYFCNGSWHIKTLYGGIHECQAQASGCSEV